MTLYIPETSIGNFWNGFGRRKQNNKMQKFSTKTLKQRVTVIGTARPRTMPVQHSLQHFPIPRSHEEAYVKQTWNKRIQNTRARRVL